MIIRNLRQTRYQFSVERTSSLNQVAIPQSFSDFRYSVIMIQNLKLVVQVNIFRDDISADHLNFVCMCPFWLDDMICFHILRHHVTLNFIRIRPMTQTPFYR